MVNYNLFSGVGNKDATYTNFDNPLEDQMLINFFYLVKFFCEVLQIEQFFIVREEDPQGFYRILRSFDSKWFHFTSF